MKKLLLSSIITSMALCANAQSWTKISTNFDSLWTGSVKYFNKGDTLICYGSTGPNSTTPKRFYVSTDGGYTFTQDTTKLIGDGLNPFVSLPINNLFLGFQNVPNSGSYVFQGLNNWSTLLPQGLGVYGEVNAGTLLWNPGLGSTQLRTLSTTGANLTIVGNGPTGIDLICTYNKGNRLFLGGGTANIKYVDSGLFDSIKTSQILPAISGSSFDVVRFFESGSALFAVISNGADKLYKSTDNGETWNLITTTYQKNSTTTNLTSIFITGTPNGNIYFLETSTGTSDNVFMSTDGGQTATKIGAGLPTNGMSISPTVGKILTNGNKVWYQVCKAKDTDFITTDTAVAGLYLLTAGNTTGINNNLLPEHELTLYPNPTHDYLHIQTNLKPTVIEIYNTLGQLVQSTTNTIDPINIQELKTGMYTLVLRTTNQQQLTTKFCKQ